MSLVDDARKFWIAAYFVRRTKDREAVLAVRVLRHLARSSNGTISTRADAVLVEYEDEQSDCGPTRTS